MFNSNFIKIFLEFLAKDYDRNKFNMLFGAFVSLFGHPLYWFICTELLNVQDSSFFRFSSSLSALLLLLFLHLVENKSITKIKSFATLYWYMWVIWILPVTFTYIMLLNDFSKLWLTAETIMIFIVIIFISNFIIIFFILSIGLYLGYYFFSLNSVQNLTITQNEFMGILTLLPLALFCGTIFIEQSKRGEYQKTNADLFKFLAGSIAHELRNPLNKINAILLNIENIIDDFKNKFLNKEDLNKIETALTSNNEIFNKIKNDYAGCEKNIGSLTDNIDYIFQSLKDANNTIDLVLSDISDKKIDESQFVYLTPYEIVDLIQKYYPNNQNFNFYSDRIKFKIPENDEYKNLYYKLIHERFYFIFNNLIKNALYYSNQFPNIELTIDFSKTLINGKEYNVINFTDNGPGIEANKIKKLFKDFSTFSKVGGTGLGLSFCKKNMKIFGGDITCNSLYGKGKQGWTKFTLIFPYPTKDEILKNKEIFQKKRILLVDDHMVNLIALKTKIEKLLPKISCDTANSGKEAISKCENNKYSLVLMDIQMPDINGIEASRRIKRFNNEISIIAATSLSYGSFKNELKKYNNSIIIGDYISKSSSNNHLARMITKHIIDFEDNFSYLNYSKENLLKILNNKKIIIADDQQLNIILLKKILEKYNIQCVLAKNGKEVIDLINDDIAKNNKISYNAIVTDINMEPVNGIELAIEIRKIENNKYIDYNHRIPIIAITGDNSHEMISDLFKAEINDYFIKGNNFDNLIKILANNFIDVLETNNSDNLINATNSHDELGLLVLNNNFINNFPKKEKNEIIELFIKDTQEILKNIQLNFEKNDCQSLSVNIHSLKGIVANIGAEKLSNYIRFLDKIVSANIYNIDDINKIFELYQELIVEIKKYIID